MEKEKEYRANRIPIAEWPELERKMGIITRMTRDPYPQRDNDTLRDQKKVLEPVVLKPSSIAKRESTT